MFKIPSAAAVLVLAFGAAPVLADAARPSFFVIDAIKADNGEIALGTLAQQRGSSPAVRDLGAMMVRDHSASKARAIAAASQVGVGIPTDMPAPAQHLQRRLLRLSGVAFDNAFLTGTIKQHRKAIAQYAEQRRGGDAVTQKLAEDALTPMSEHLRVALSLR